MAEAANYHISLWPEPPGPPTYLCLLCSVKDCTEAEIQTHIATAHEVTPVPTPLAADTNVVPTLIRRRNPAMADAPTPTYWTETTAAGETVYHCAYCAAAGQEHHSADEALFVQHMEQRHDGRMVEDTEASAKKPEDAGQPGSPPGHDAAPPHGGTPPGQGGTPPGQVDKPDEEEDLHPEHPIVLPEGEPKPEEGV
jgi:hypothetical protein